MPVILTIPAPPRSAPLRLIPFTPDSFAPFGTCVQRPASTTAAISVNQGTAHKFLRVSPQTNTYPASPPSTACLNIFSCSPRPLPPSGIFTVSILERHPFTSQTFVPLALSAAADATTWYVVIVAPTGCDGAPVLDELTAFKCRGDQAVTYRAGTWHAPMVVVGEDKVDFCVFNAENGTAMDCEEAVVDSGVAVRVKEGNWGLWEGVKAKL